MKTLQHSTTTTQTASLIFFTLCIGIFVSTLLVRNQANSLSTSIAAPSVPVIVQSIKTVAAIPFSKLPDPVVEEFTSKSTSVNAATSTAAISSTVFSYINENYTEAPLAIEDWMVNTAHWSNITSEEYIEEPIEIQEWMTSTAAWSSLADEAFEEEPLSIQGWMTDINQWNTVN